MQKTCSIDGLQRFREKNKDGAVAIITQKGCEPCTPQKKALKAIVGNLPIIEIPAEKTECDAILDELKVEDTPTVLFFAHGDMKRVSDGTKTYEEVAEEVKALMEKK